MNVVNPTDHEEPPFKWLSWNIVLSSIVAAMLGVCLVASFLVARQRDEVGVALAGTSSLCAGLLLFLMRHRSRAISTCVLSIAGPMALGIVIWIYLWSRG
jgi:hypothetical protein